MLEGMKQKYRELKQWMWIYLFIIKAQRVHFFFAYKNRYTGVQTIQTLQNSIQSQHKGVPNPSVTLTKSCEKFAGWIDPEST